MRILVHDYGRYPFIFQVAKLLAARGHEVRYVCSGAVPARSSLDVPPELAAGLSVAALDAPKGAAGADLVKRFRHERSHGKSVARDLAAYAPDVVLSANAPLDAQVSIERWCRKNGVLFVYWLQDLCSVAVRHVLRRRMPVVGIPLGAWYTRLERGMLLRSRRVIVITEAHVPHLLSFGVDESRVEIVENWAPVEDVPLLPKDNDWARSHGLEKAFTFLYSGALGQKHDPRPLLNLARRCTCGGARVVAVCEGPGAVLLTRLASEQGLESLTVLPFQPYSAMPQVLATADVLVANLDKAAAGFSVPSKVLTYMCAGRPILLAMPADNPASRLVKSAGAGLVVDSEDEDALVCAANELRADECLRARLGSAARAYAETAWNAEAIADRFEGILARATRS